MTSRLLQVLPSVITKADNELEIEVDYCEGIRLCLDNFDEVSVACPVTTEILDSGLRRCRRVKDLPWQNRIRIIPLPSAYNWRDFLRHYEKVRRVLRAEIENADYLMFSPHSLIGDWPTVAAREAVRLKRSYVMEADVVYEGVGQVGWARKPLWKRLIKKHIGLPLFQLSYHYCLKHSGLALFQGQDVYDAYSPFCSNPHKVYHMPISKDDYITDVQLQNKLSSLDESRALKACYIGRAIEMKGPMDWLKTLHELNKAGVAISAAWLGDGSLLPSMRSMAENLGLAHIVQFPGYVANRDEILQTLRDADIFLFCHKTPESPRCLVEALVSGCPLIGYGGAYPKDLVGQCGGGQFAPVGDWKALANIVTELNKDREKLRELIRTASVSGRLYERDATMQRRIDLIKEYLGPANAS
jgi:glycosyltransferase involved in cell wall biosynthesis